MPTGGEIILSNEECKNRLLVNMEGKEHYLVPSDEKRKNIVTNLDDVRNVGSISADVYFRSLMVAKYSILKKPLGWGFNRYVEAFNTYIESYPP